MTNVADLAWGFDYDAVGTGRTSYLRGTLEVTRKPGTTTPLRVEGMQGSVLFRLQQTARPTLGPGDDRVSVPLRVRWGRCDEHAISESSQTFLWKLDISVDGRGAGADHHHRRRRRQGPAAGLPQEGLCLTS